MSTSPPRAALLRTRPVKNQLTQYGTQKHEVVYIELHVSTCSTYRRLLTLISVHGSPVDTAVSMTGHGAGPYGRPCNLARVATGFTRKDGCSRSLGKPPTGHQLKERIHHRVVPTPFVDLTPCAIRCQTCSLHRVAHYSLQTYSHHLGHSITRRPTQILQMQNGRTSNTTNAEGRMLINRNHTVLP
jgi:hypothetical protein